MNLLNGYLKKTKQLRLGYTIMKTNFTQIYDKTREKALKLLENNAESQKDQTEMPEIENARETLCDIYNQTAHTSVMKWIYQHAK